MSFHWFLWLPSGCSLLCTNAEWAFCSPEKEQQYGPPQPGIFACITIFRLIVKIRKKDFLAANVTDCNKNDTGYRYGLLRASCGSWAPILGSDTPLVVCHSAHLYWSVGRRIKEVYNLCVSSSFCWVWSVFKNLLFTLWVIYDKILGLEWEDVGLGRGMNIWVLFAFELLSQRL